MKAKYIWQCKKCKRIITSIAKSDDLICSECKKEQSPEWAGYPLTWGDEG